MVTHYGPPAGFKHSDRILSAADLLTNEEQLRR